MAINVVRLVVKVSAPDYAFGNEIGAATRDWRTAL
jgi:hypothetical protein